jgi:hypothetical protein
LIFHEKKVDSNVNSFLKSMFLNQNKILSIKTYHNMHLFHFSFFRTPFLLVLFLQATLPFAYAQSTGTLGGSVTDKITQEAIIGATIRLEGTQLGASTDAEGKFKLAGIPTKSYNVSVSYLGYATQTRYNIVITTGNANFINFELETDAKSLNEVTISENKSVRIASAETPLSVQNLSAQEIKANPGGNFDISQVITTLPGVGGTAASGAFRNDLLIRGGGPGENVFYLDGVEIPVINHFSTQGSSGGAQGILNVTFIEDVSLATSSFSTCTLAVTGTGGGREPAATPSMHASSDSRGPICLMYICLMYIYFNIYIMTQHKRRGG